ncbi:class-II fumarase/aspartase family protein [Anderseniella sp. Alg231-50]|uniref:class-II fumarase/aspartase family protein n=1 Tax=Anderseniella sp. Alg231-50 TaxID=1922226 RepID=UPI00307C6E21
MTGFAHVQDSRLLGHLFSTVAMKEVFSDTATLRCWLEVEAALARVQSDLKLIPEAAADAICTACASDKYDLAQLGSRIAAASHPLTPVIAAIEANSGEYGQYVHFGATTQDIMDSGLVLQMRTGLNLLTASHEHLLAACVLQARTWRELPMAGRTHGQHAVPITLGLKFALLASEVKRHLERLCELAAMLPVQFAGAAGTLATLGLQGAGVREALAKMLGLVDSKESWHTGRDLIAHITSQVAISAATCGKIANEIVNLQRTEIGELAEGAAPGTGGSSTMPQKRNPMLAQNIVALARLMAVRPPLALDAMMHEHERDMAAWTMEWAVVPESFIYGHAAVEQCTTLVANLQVDEARIAQNLAHTGGLICAEAVMMDLAGDMGRTQAHHAVADLISQARQTGVSFAEVLNDDTRIGALRSPEQIATLLDPANYTGDAVQTVDRIVRELE